MPAAQLIERDPENRLLARGPRIRLSAEMIRDQALAVERPARRAARRPVGPAVSAGRAVEGARPARDYKAGHGADLYRRSLYTFWKRTVAPPAMVTFDASTPRDLHASARRGPTRRCRRSTCSTT